MICEYWLCLSTYICVQNEGDNIIKERNWALWQQILLLEGQGLLLEGPWLLLEGQELLLEGHGLLLEGHGLLLKKHGLLLDEQGPLLEGYLNFARWILDFW